MGDQFAAMRHQMEALQGDFSELSGTHASDAKRLTEAINGMADQLAEVEVTVKADHDRILAVEGSQRATLERLALVEEHARQAAVGGEHGAAQAVVADPSTIAVTKKNALQVSVNSPWFASRILNVIWSCRSRR